MPKSPYVVSALPYVYIWNALYDGDLNTIKMYIENYDEKNDMTLQHPILHQIAYHAGHDPDNKNFSSELQERFYKQNETFKFIWSHPKFQHLINNKNYVDKYGNTAVERLNLRIKHYPYYMKIWISKNIKEAKL